MTQLPDSVEVTLEAMRRHGSGDVWWTWLAALLLVLVVVWCIRDVRRGKENQPVRIHGWKGWFWV